MPSVVALITSAPGTLVPHATTNIKSLWRIYKYGWLVNPTTLTHPVWIGFDEIRRLASKAVEENPKQAEQYRAGKSSLFGFFVGQVMKSSGGRANPQVVNRILKGLLEGEGT